MLDRKEVGDCIKNYRKTLGLTQIEFAEKLQTTQAAISQYESGARYPDWTTIVKLKKNGFPLDQVLK